MTSAERASQTETDAGVRGKLVHWVRDPIEIIISGYFYHVKASEKWLRVVGSSVVASLQRTCKKNEQPLPSAGPMQLVCRALDQISSKGEWIRLIQRGGASYQRLLQLLPLKAGLLAEAYRAVPTLMAMNTTFHALESAGSGFALTVDLDEATNDCDSEFGKMFAFLEVKATRAAHCVELGCFLINSGSPSSHSTKPDANDVERTRLRQWLQQQPFVAENVEPLRQSMGYRSKS